MLLKNHFAAVIVFLVTLSSAIANATEQSASYDLNIMNETFQALTLSTKDNSTEFNLPYGVKTITEKRLIELCKNTLGNCQFYINAPHEIQMIATIVLDYSRRQPVMWILPNNNRYSFQNSAEQDGFKLRIGYSTTTNI